LGRGASFGQILYPKGGAASMFPSALTIGGNYIIGNYIIDERKSPKFGQQNYDLERDFQAGPPLYCGFW